MEDELSFDVFFREKITITLACYHELDVFSPEPYREREVTYALYNPAYSIYVYASVCIMFISRRIRNMVGLTTT